MKFHGYGKFYKYIYNIFYEIKGHRLININKIDIFKISLAFTQVEKEFLKKYPNKANMLSYNVVIYCILKFFKYKCAEHIILPINKKAINEVMNLLKHVVKPMK
jgi:hypothetical protein